VGDFIFGGNFGGAFGGMSGATALATGIVAGLVLTTFYLLKLRRRRVLVPFASLWLSAGGERRSERLARRLRRWLSLLLQLIFVALLLLAAVDPRSAQVDRAGRTLLILVDRSASMSATDEEGPRLGRARAIARDLATGLGNADRAMIASFAAGVAAETGFEADAARLGPAVERIGPSEEPGDLGRALDFATAVLRGRPHPTLVLVSDGAFSPDDLARAASPSRLAGVDVRFARVGRRADNLALLSFAARRYPADPSSIEAAVVVQSFRDWPSDVVLEISAGADARPVDRVRLHLAPHERLRHLLPDVAAPDTRLVARLADHHDDLATDDRAYAVIPGVARARVLRVGDADLFLDGALLSLGGAVSVHRASARDVEATRATWARYDAVIFDGVVPSPAPTAGHFIYLDPHGPASPFPERGRLREPIVSDTRKGHPLLRHVSLADLNIGEAHRLALGAGDEAVASALDAPLILTRARPDLRIVALAFDLRASDLPMRAAFPLLLGNALGWLGTPDGAETASLRTGRSLRVVQPEGRAEAPVTDPAGATQIVAVTAGEIEIPIARTGFYRIGSSMTLAANLGDAVESDTTPAAHLIVGGKTLPPPDPPRRHARRPIWWWALLAAAALSLTEWWTYHRRWTV
jgi:von Willebrand factor type A domain/Aerotolerance regulator N-terminal